MLVLFLSSPKACQSPRIPSWLCCWTRPDAPLASCARLACKCHGLPVPEALLLNLRGQSAVVSLTNVSLSFVGPHMQPLDGAAEDLGIPVPATEATRDLKPVLSPASEANRSFRSSFSYPDRSLAFRLKENKLKTC